MTYVLVLKFLSFIWLCVFVYYTVVVFFEDGKFGRYCWYIALLVGVFMSTALPIILIFDAIKNPIDPFSRLRHMRRSKKR